MTKCIAKYGNGYQLIQHEEGDNAFVTNRKGVVLYVGAIDNGTFDCLVWLSKRDLSA